MKAVCAVFALILTMPAAVMAADEAPVPVEPPPPGTRIYTLADFPEPQPPLSWPQRAMDDEVEGAVTIACQVGEGANITGCAIIEETPKGYEFGILTIRVVLMKAKIDTSPAPPPGTWLRQAFQYKY